MRPSKPSESLYIQGGGRTHQRPLTVEDGKIEIQDNNATDSYLQMTAYSGHLLPETA